MCIYIYICTYTYIYIYRGYIWVRPILRACEYVGYRGVRRRPGRGEVCFLLE